jgi:glycosyltransferase involved in cell wall biosynthesis/O-antigen/teichoic acid export membrane protein
VLARYIKRGAYNTFFYGLSSAINRIVSFLFLPYFLSVLTLKEFGIWDFYQTFFSLGTTTLISCASASLIRFYFLYKDNDPIKCKQSIGNACLLVIVGMGLFLCSLFFLSYFNYIPLENRYLLITFVNICLFSTFALVTAFLRVKEMLVTYLIIFSGQGLIATALTVVGIWYGWAIDAFFYATLCSLIIFLPSFFTLLFLHFSFSWSLLKEQLAFSIPLLLYSIIFMGFFSFDRWFIKIMNGYEELGTYSLLWRFGVLFQFFSIALIDAWPVVSYNVAKEKDGKQLLTRLLSYYNIILVSLGLACIAGSHCLIAWFVKLHYANLMAYFPLFFLSLVLLDSARTFQTGFCITTKTKYIPFLTLATLLCQTFLFFIITKISYLTLWKVLFINCSAFIFYMIISYYYGSKIADYTIDLRRIVTTLLYGCCYFILFECIFMYDLSWHYSVVLVCTWPLLVWFANIVDGEDKEGFWKKLYYSKFASNCLPTLKISDAHNYSDLIVGKRIAILGPYPPPLGGISVHIQRVKNKFINQHNEVRVFDTMHCCAKFFIHPWYIFISLLRWKPAIIYYHTAYTYHGAFEFIPLICAARLLRSELILVEHDCRYLDSRSYFFKIIFAVMMRFVTQQIFMGTVTYESYKKHNIVVKQNSVIETPFLPPEENEQAFVEKYPSEFDSFLAMHSPLISANAFQAVLVHEQDLYGIEWCIDLVTDLKNEFPNVGFIICISKIGNEKFFLSMVNKIKQYKLENSIYILLGNHLYWPILKKIDLFVRPTLSDNFGISIAEALHFGKKAIASDVCRRPKDTILFKGGDKKDFFEKVYYSLQELSPNNQKINKYDVV